MACIIHPRGCTGDADVELEVEGNEGAKCMRERGEGERGEWEWDEGWGGLGGVLGREPSVGLSRQKEKPRPIPVGGSRGAAGEEALEVA